MATPARHARPSTAIMARITRRRTTAVSGATPSRRRTVISTASPEAAAIGVAATTARPSSNLPEKRPCGSGSDVTSSACCGEWTTIGSWKGTPGW